MANLAKAVHCVAPVAAQLGEGPLWDPRAHRLFWVDIKGGKLFAYDPATNDYESWALGGAVSAIALARSEGFVCACRNGFGRLLFKNGVPALIPITNPETSLTKNRFNDGKADTAGGFWAGSMDDEENAVTGAWWRLQPDGVAVKLVDQFKITNGPAFDEKRGRVFLTDSAQQVIYVSRTDGARLQELQSFLTFTPGDGYPDGMEIDEEGCLWVAFWDAGVVRRFDPDAVLLEEIAVPAPRPTSLAIVANRLYVTSARIGLTSETLQKYPASGGLFCVELSKPLEAGARYVDDSLLARA